MLLLCPSCEATYRISSEAVGAGRRVRCARCRNEWFAEGLVPIEGLEDAAAIDVVETPPNVADAVELAESDRGEWAPAPAPKPRRLKMPFLKRKAPRVTPARPLAKRGATIKIRPAAIAAAVGLGALALGVFERAPIVRAVPSLASLYRLAGLEVNVRGLAIRDVASVEEIDGGVPLLLVTGAVANVTDQPIDVPRLRLAVTTGDDRELYAWTTIAARPKLSPGEAAAFRARLASPPAEGRAVAVRFLARQDLVSSASR